MKTQQKRGIYTKYAGTSLSETIDIKRIYSFFYFERSKDYVFEGERHNFWEFLYVDKGEVEVMADTEGFLLQQGDIIFHKPNEFHSIWANKKSSPNLIVISFDCNSPAISSVEKKIYSIYDKQAAMLSQIIKEGRRIFVDYDSNENRLIKNENAPFGYEQLFKIHLEEFLIEIIINGKNQNKAGKLNSVMKERVEGDLVKKILKYLEGNLYRKISFSDICRFNIVSETQLKVLFKERMGVGVMKYYKILKIDEAKKLIREENYNITQISDMLGYSSIHYFSKAFKEICKMTPSEYATSISARL